MSQPPPRFSVLIARVGTEDHERILETLDALRRQDCDFAYEVIVADRLGDAVTRRIAIEHPGVILLAGRPGDTIPQLRAAAWRAARGARIAVTEDHCVPCAGWLRALDAGLDADPMAAAAGGAVVNGVPDSAFHWATFLCEYAAYVPPLPVDAVPSGVNVAYRRERLAAAPAAALVDGFWEMTLHPWLAASGARWVSADDALVWHRKRFSPTFFMTQRFAYSRHFAGTRFARAQRGRRLAAAIASTALPLLLAMRFARLAATRPALSLPMWRAAPWLALFSLVWAAGEAAGYIAGPGDALRRIE